MTTFHYSLHLSMLRLGRPNPRFPASSFKILVFNIFALICNRVRSFFCFGIEVDFHAFWCLANIFTGSVFFSFKGPLYFFFRLGVDIAVFLSRTPLEVAGRGVERLIWAKAPKRGCNIELQERHAEGLIGPSATNSVD